MCFTTKYKPKIQIAKRDILVWKVLRVGYRSEYAFNDGYTYQYVFDVVHKIDEIKIIHFVRQYWINEYTINQGFHSYSKKSLVPDSPTSGTGRFGLFLHPFIIPKGAHYCVDHNQGQCVSDRIRMIKPEQSGQYKPIRKSFPLILNP